MKPSFIKTPIGNFLAHFNDRYLIRLELASSIEKLFHDQNLQETVNELAKGNISVKELPLNFNKLVLMKVLLKPYLLAYPHVIEQ